MLLSLIASATIVSATALSSVQPVALNCSETYIQTHTHKSGLAWFSNQWVCVLQGGEVLQETIAANVTEEWVSLEFQRSDGTLVTQILDFKNVSIHYIYTTTYIIYRSRGVKSQRMIYFHLDIQTNAIITLIQGREGKIIEIEYIINYLLLMMKQSVK